MTEAIRAEKLVKTFGKITALAGVSLEVAWGETLGILGDNGAGKSTLIKILSGVHPHDAGDFLIMVNSRVISDILCLCGFRVQSRQHASLYVDAVRCAIGRQQ